MFYRIVASLAVAGAVYSTELDSSRVVTNHSDYDSLPQEPPQRERFPPKERFAVLLKDEEIEGAPQETRMERVPESKTCYVPPKKENKILHRRFSPNQNPLRNFKPKY